MTLHLARVAAVHPEDHSVDVVLVHDGARLAGVQVLAYAASSDTGLLGLPAPAIPASGDKWDLRDRTSRDALAVLGYVGRMPVVLGFLTPQINGVTFADGRLVLRHQSGAYLTMSKAGAVELVYPGGGTYLRLGPGGHEDLAGKDFDGRWREAAGAPAASITLSTGLATVTLTPGGGATITCKQDINVTTPNLRVAGNIVVTGGNVTADGISLKTHVHTGVQVGGGNTGPPAS